MGWLVSWLVTAFLVLATFARHVVWFSGSPITPLEGFVIGADGFALWILGVFAILQSQFAREVVEPPGPSDVLDEVASPQKRPTGVR